MDTQDFVNNMFDSVLAALKNNAYQLENSTFLYLEQLKDVDIYTTDSLPTSILFRDWHNNIIAKFESPLSSPQVIDPVPVIINHKIVVLKPVMILPYDANTETNQWIIMHELCHLLSLGQYSQCGCYNIWKHYFGLNQYTYMQTDDELKIISQEENFKANEIFNDAVTWHFMELVKNQPVIPNNKFIQRKSEKIKLRDDFCYLIGLYFSNQIESLEKYLKI